MAEEAEEVLALRDQLVSQTTCPLCSDIFSEPVLTACGHSFCEPCLAGVLEDHPGTAPCPQCRAPVEPGSLRPNRSLGDVAEVVRSLKKVAAWPRCPQHDEPLALFCEPCAALICASCQHGPERGWHRVRPAEEAARQLRETLHANRLSLQEEKEKLKGRGDQTSEDLLGAVMWELQRVPETFEELQQCMEEQKKTLLAQLKQMSQELVSKCEVHRSWALEWQSQLDTVIAQIEEKVDQPAVEFLMDVGRILNSCKAAKALIPAPVSPELQSSVESLTRKSQRVVDMVAKFKVGLRSEIDRESEQVTLDPQMAGPYLILSQDHKMLRFSRIRNHGDSPKRFLSCPSILGSQGFTSGRHYWEVKVGKGGYCALGVALESVPSEDQLRSGKVWALRQKLCGRYTAVPTPPYPLAVREELQRIRVHLDYEAGRVTFYNAKDMTQILQFQATFTEKVFPYFWIRSVDNHIHLCD